MDVIASGAEACPWGLNGYGFDPILRRRRAMPCGTSPVLGRIMSATTLAAEEVSRLCLRLGYEDLAPTRRARRRPSSASWPFPPAPGVSRACFSGGPRALRPGGPQDLVHLRGSAPARSAPAWSVPTGHDRTTGAGRGSTSWPAKLGTCRWTTSGAPRRRRRTCGWHRRPTARGSVLRAGACRPGRSG